MWAEHAGADRYRLLNLPYMVEGVALGDIVAVKPERIGRWPLFDRVVERSGHSSYRIALQDGATFDGAFRAAWEPLAAIGCGVERFSERFAGIDVPPTTDVSEAYRLLEEGMASGVWWFDEIQFGHALAEPG